MYDGIVWEKLSKSLPFHNENMDRVHLEALANCRITLPQTRKNVDCDTYPYQLHYSHVSTSITESRASSVKLSLSKRDFGVLCFYVLPNWSQESNPYL